LVSAPSVASTTASTATNITAAPLHMADDVDYLGMPLPTPLPAHVLMPVEVSARKVQSRRPRDLKPGSAAFVDPATEPFEHPPNIATLSRFDVGWSGTAMQSMAYAFLASGAGCVLTCLWKVRARCLRGGCPCCVALCDALLCC
jgi:hypothetical protein